MMATERARRERGAVLIHVAIALVALLAFTAFVVDYGTMWIARIQAQTAADAGALAGADALAYDAVGTDPVPVRQSAHTFANKHAVWGEQVTDATTDVVTSLDAPPFLCPDGTATCVRVDVFRGAPDRTGATRGNPLPAFFARILGITSQPVRATATAQAGSANVAECLKPWAVADKWVEVRPTAKEWQPGDTFDRYDKNGGLLPGDVDSYTPPTTDDPGTGFSPDNDYGLQLVLKMGSGNQNVYSSGWFQALDLPQTCEGGGANCYEQNITGCTTLDFKIGDTVTVDNEPGNMVGPTKSGVETLVATDASARWVSTGPWVPGQPQPGQVQGSSYAQSPRIVPVPLLDLQAYLSADPEGKGTVPIVNIMGFFVEGTCDQKGASFTLETYNAGQCGNGGVVGRLMTAPGMKSGTVPVEDESAFLKTIQLVR